jgi:hypothetical protein
MIAARDTGILGTSAATLTRRCRAVRRRITALFALSNRMANLMALEPNAEFYLMGRVPGSR